MLNNCDFHENRCSKNHTLLTDLDKTIYILSDLHKLRQGRFLQNVLSDGEVKIGVTQATLHSVTSIFIARFG
jgi:hypothetical protein